MESTVSNWKAQRALQIRYKAAMKVLRENPGMAPDDRYGLLAMVVAPIDCDGQLDLLLGIEADALDLVDEDEARALVASLTYRQRVVLSSLAEHRQPRLVAEELGVSRQAVYQMAKDIKKRFGVTSIAQVYEITQLAA